MLEVIFEVVVGWDRVIFFVFFDCIIFGLGK